MGSLDMSQNQNGISGGFSAHFSVNFFSIELGPRFFDWSQVKFEFNFSFLESA